jgi:hypothetical protein
MKRIFLYRCVTGVFFSVAKKVGILLENVYNYEKQMPYL